MATVETLSSCGGISGRNICRSMKTPTHGTEKFEFNIGRAPNLRCLSQGETTCGHCETCQLNKRMKVVQSWFPRCGDQSKRRFLLGIVRRLQSVDLLIYLNRILEPLLRKDYMYARMRPNPSLDNDCASMSSDRALPQQELEMLMRDAWCWFQSSDYWSKSNFLLNLLPTCDSHLLHSVGSQAKTLLAAEKHAFIEEDNYEEESIASSNYTFRSQDHSELELLTTVASDYSVVGMEPTEYDSRESDCYSGMSHINEADSGDESLETVSNASSEDPTCLVVPSSAKAHSGVAKRKDFIHQLPVHLSKCILGYLDEPSLHNCRQVSQYWALLVEEVNKEYHVNQHLWEQVMLMQGAGAQGVNPFYAKDIDVPVPNVEIDSWNTITTGTGFVDTKFKSEMSFQAAYGGYSVRNIIMEERNVYCGAYNVMVLVDQSDTSRVIDSNGEKLITLGSQSRKICFINSGTGRPEDPVITGHAGSVRCLALNEKEGYVLSGSFDTSIRYWSLETGKCQKIYRGHTDTVLCMQICGDMMVSGGKECHCKVWNLESRKSLRTFKHRHPITAVAMSEKLCLSGCEAGRVKVWDLKTGKLIKKLNDHTGAVTGIKFDSWHIVTSGKDGYALAWSAQGDHNKCLTALRHPKDVLCLELMYLRVITGCSDGKLRIWNMITGQCLRIMRGNSRSDPITHLVANNNRIIINTANNVLVLNFETVDYDYTLDDDKMGPLVQYGQYSETPIRNQPYLHVRANRMKKAGATNTKIVCPDGRDTVCSRYRPPQTPHSAKTLSKATMESARRIQSATARLETTGVTKSQYYGNSAMLDVSKQKQAGSVAVSAPSSYGGVSKARGPSARTASHSVISGGAFKLGRPEDDIDSSDSENENGNKLRRMSWAFDPPNIPRTKQLTLTDTKSLLRSQMRSNGDIVPPNFIYLSVNAMQMAMKRSELSTNMEANRRQEEIENSRKLGRPSSSPCRIDPRTKVPVDDLEWEHFLIEQRLLKDTDKKSECAESQLSLFSKSSNGRKSTGAKYNGHRVFANSPAPVTKHVYSPPNISSKDMMNQNQTVKHTQSRPWTSIPRGTAVTESAVRPQTASSRIRAKSTVVIQEQPMYNYMTQTVCHKNMPSSSAVNSSITPMRMCSADMNRKLQKNKERTAERQAHAQKVEVDEDGKPMGKVTVYNDPMRTHVQFQLHTHQQVEQQMRKIEDDRERQKRRIASAKQRKEKQDWLIKVKGGEVASTKS